MLNHGDDRDFKRDRVFMAMAEDLSTLGTCNRLQVGALLVKEGRIIATGYNGAPSHFPHCDHQNDEPCRISVHAEANVIAFAARLGGVGSEGATLYVTHSPCWECAKLIINAGIAKVIFIHAYRLTDGLELLNAAHIPYDSLLP